MTDWLFNGQEFPPEEALNYVGFVYIITNLTNNKKYIGKKLFHFSKTKQVKGKKKRFKVQSDWPTYYGSNVELQKDVEVLGFENFTRCILYLCKSKGTCSYLEAKEQFGRNVLESDEYYNQWIFLKVSRSHLKLKEQNVKRISKRKPKDEKQ